MKPNAKRRINIPKNTEASVTFSSDRLCCIDQKKGVHIHHIDGNPGNNNFNNLALLCFDCHDEATKTGSLSKKLTPQTILKYREHHYNTIKEKRKSSISIVTKKEAHPTYADNINAAIQGSVLIEIAKIKYEYLSSIQVERNDILMKLDAFSAYNFPRVCIELFEFLDQVAYETRAGLSLRSIITITTLVENYFPPEDTKVYKSVILATGSLALKIAFGIIYDTSIYTHKYHSMKQGYDLLHLIYVVSEQLKNKDLRKEADLTLKEIEESLNRPERDDLDIAKEMFSTFNEGFKKNVLIYPQVNDKLWGYMQTEKY